MAYSKNRRLAEIVSDTSGNISVEGIVVPTQSNSDNDTSAASTAFVHAHVNALVDSAPGTLNTLNELAAALNDQANFGSTITTAVNAKAPLASPDFTGQIQVSNAASTIQELTVTGNNTRSTLRVNSKDASGNSVDLRMHSLGDGPRAELFTYSNHDLAFATNNAAPQMTLKTDGKFGIGTQSPNTRLTVGSGSGTEVLTILAGTGGESQLRFADGTSGTAAYQGRVEYDHANSLLNLGAGGGTQVTIDSSGNVGIGTASPRRQMHIHNSASATVGLMLTNGNTGESNDSQGFQFKVGSDSHAEISQMENSDLRIFTNASEKMRIGSDGAVTIKPTGITTGLRLQGRSSDNNFFIQFNNNDGSTNYGSIGNNSGQSAGYYSFDNHIFTNTSSANEYMRINSSGNVGIGVTNPIYGQLQIGDFTDATEALTFATSGNGSSYINFYDANATEGVFIKSTGQTYGGSLIIGAKWDTEETEFTFVALKTGTSSFAINNGGDFTNANGDLNIHATSDDLVLTAEDDVFIQSGNGSSLKTVTLANNGQTSFPGDVLPVTDSAHNLGSTSLRWANLYTGDLHLSNEGSQNDVDGTSGNWTIQEGEEHLFIINNKNGKKFKFTLEEVE